MNTIESYQSEIAAQLESVSNDAPQAFLARSLFDVPLDSVVNALAHGDNVAPILTANALRRQLQPEMSSEKQWETCAAFVARTVVTINTSTPSVYAREEKDLTRTTYGNTSREAATAMCCYGTFSEQNPFDGVVDAASYGLDHHAYTYSLGKPLSALNDKIVATFALKNTFGIGFTDQYPFDIVYPGLLFNSQILGVLVGYDIIADRKRGRCAARHILLLPSDEPDGIVTVTQHNVIKNQRRFAHQVPKLPDDYEEIGAITLAPPNCSVDDLLISNLHRPSAY